MTGEGFSPALRPRKAWFDLSGAEAAPDVAIVGLPYDRGVSLRTGASQAPGTIREISRSSDPVTRRGHLVDGVSVGDLGDIAPRGVGDDQEAQTAYFERVGDALRVVENRTLLLALGGDNSVTIPVLASVSKRAGDDLSVLWFDAHSDLISSYQGNPNSHACALRRAMTLTGIPPEHVFLLGTRSYAKEEIAFIRDNDIRMLTAADVAESNPETVAARIVEFFGKRPVYFAIDIDGFDSACAPGTGYPMPAGVRSETFFSIFDRIMPTLNVVAADITEVCPPRDPSGVTSFLAAQIVLELLGALAHGARASAARRASGA